MLHRSMHQDITRIKETMNATGKENRLSENAATVQWSLGGTNVYLNC